MRGGGGRSASLVSPCSLLCPEQVTLRKPFSQYKQTWKFLQKRFRIFAFFPSETADMLQSRPVYRNAALHEQKQSGSAFVTKPPCTFLLIKNLIRKPYFAESMHLPAYLRS